MSTNGKYIEHKNRHNKSNEIVYFTRQIKAFTFMQYTMQILHVEISIK